MNERTEMLAGVSHDLRTPLTRLKLQLSMLPKNSEITSMNSDIEEMETMINDYLSFAKDNVAENFSKINLRKFFNEIIKHYSSAKFNIKLAISGTQIEFNLRKQSFKRSISNIIENSKRYSNNTEISLKKTEDSLIILIDDDGPGIEAQDRENAMRPFFRLETSRNKSTGGTGLGLSIANNIILSHGGKLELLSSPLGGLRVKLSMPL